MSVFDFQRKLTPHAKTRIQTPANTGLTKTIRPVAQKVIGIVMEVRTLAGAIFQSAGLARKPIILGTSCHSPLLTLVSQICHLPISWRKLILDACRIQSPFLQNNHLSLSYRNILPTRIACDHGETMIVLVFEDLIPYIDIATSCPVTSSFLSYFIRAEIPCRALMDEFLLEKDKSFAKEFTEAIRPPSYEYGRLHYGALFATSQMPMHLELGGYASSQLQRLYKSGIDQIRTRAARFDQRILLPVYNRRKNIAYSSQEAFYELCGLDPLFEDRSITTLDLLRHYARTGDTISGPLEMRQAWKPSELKPRTYYCQGGSSYFDTLYIKEISNWIVDILPSTNRFSRYSVGRLTSASRPYSLLITYDYFTFTTCLEELQTYLHMLSFSLMGVTVTVLDVYGGVREIDVGLYIQAYNQQFNVNDVFSIERLDGTCTEFFRQGRSGSLGVKGNITFSTALHGAALASFTNTPFEDCCVGDDALTTIMAEQLNLFILAVNYLGGINPEKFTSIPYQPDCLDTYIHRYKFLKRPLFRGADGMPVQGILDFFPSISEIFFPDGDGIHSHQPCSRAARVRTFAMQLGRFLSIQLGEFDSVGVTYEDMDFLLGSLYIVYDRLTLPLEGSVPGFLVDGERIEVFIPPISKDVFTIHWMECLIGEHLGAVFDRPVFIDGDLHPPFDLIEGERFRSTPSALLDLMVGLEYMTKEMQMETVIFDAEELDIQLSILRGERLNVNVLCEYVALFVPVWYFEVALQDYPDLTLKDPDEARSVVTSLIGHSSC